MKKLFVIVAFALVGCRTSSGHSLAPGHRLAAGGEQELMQIVACCPGMIRAGNDDKCAILATANDHCAVINNIETCRTMNESNCQTIDETPFWGYVN